MKVHNYRELLVWQSNGLSNASIFIYKFFSKRSRTTTKDLQHFLNFSMGSSFELETQMILAFRFGYISESQVNDFLQAVGTI